MPKRFRLTRRQPLALTEDAYRRLKRLAGDTGLDEGEALSFLLENLDAITDDDQFAHRMRLFNATLDARKR
jgi:hypothetical protein